MVVKDPHLRGGYESPVSRTDDYEDTMYNKIRSIHNIAKKHNVKYLLIPGDILDKKYRSEYNINTLDKNLELFKKLIEPFVKVITIPGNHDLPFNSINNYSNSVYKIVVEHFDKVIDISNRDIIIDDYRIFGVPFGCKWQDKVKEFNKSADDDTTNIVMLHEHFIPMDANKNELKFISDLYYYEDLTIYDKIDYFVFGHLHRGFDTKYYKIGSKKQYYINPWNLYRLSRNYYTVNDSHKPEVVIFGKNKEPEHFIIDYKKFDDVFIEKELKRESEINNDIVEKVNEIISIKSDGISFDGVKQEIIDVIQKYMSMTEINRG